MSGLRQIDNGPPGKSCRKLPQTSTRFVNQENFCLNIFVRVEAIAFRRDNLRGLEQCGFAIIMIGMIGKLF